MDNRRSQHRDGYWRSAQPRLGAAVQRSSTSGPRLPLLPLPPHLLPPPPPPPPPHAARRSSQQDHRLPPWHRAPAPVPAAGLGPPAGPSFPPFGGHRQGPSGYGYGYHGGNHYGSHYAYPSGPPNPFLALPPPPPPPPRPTSPPLPPLPSPPFPSGHLRRPEDHHHDHGPRKGYRLWDQQEHLRLLAPPPPAVVNNGPYHHQTQPVERYYGSAQALSTRGGWGAGCDHGWVGGSGRGGECDLGGDRGTPLASHGRKRGYEELSPSPEPSTRHGHPVQPYRPYQPLPSERVPPFSGTLENRAKFSMNKRKRAQIQPGRILFLKHQSSIHLFTCLIYQMGDNDREFGRAEFQKVERFFNHPVIIMEAPNHRDLVKVVTMTTLGGLTPEEKYAEDNFNEDKHGGGRAELFRSDYIEIHHPGVSDAAPNPGGTTPLFLKNGKKMMERSYVNLDGGKTYWVEAQYLVPYQDRGERNADYRLQEESFSFLVARRAQLEADKEAKDRAKWPSGKAPTSRW